MTALTLPAVGFGTWPLKGADAEEVVSRAIDTGYRLLDSAVNYENEGAVGAAVRRSAVPRDELIVTSKLPGRHHAYDEALATVQESVYRTGLDAIDLYLIHWPLPRLGLYVEAWRALIEAQQRGLVRHIGVSNFLPEHLAELERSTGVLPVVNQIELHPYFPQVEAVRYHEAHGIVTEAWSPIGRGNDLLSNPVITQIAADREISAAQVVLAWHVSRGIVPLPKASGAERQRENLAAAQVTLSADEVERITGLGRPDGRAKGQDPATWEEY